MIPAFSIIFSPLTNLSLSILTHQPKYSLTNFLLTESLLIFLSNLFVSSYIYLRSYNSPFLYDCRLNGGQSINNSYYFSSNHSTIKRKEKNSRWIMLTDLFIHFTTNYSSGSSNSSSKSSRNSSSSSNSNNNNNHGVKMKCIFLILLLCVSINYSSKKVKKSRFRAVRWW